MICKCWWLTGGQCLPSALKKLVWSSGIHYAKLLCHLASERAAVLQATHTLQLCQYVFTGEKKDWCCVGVWAPLNVSMLYCLPPDWQAADGLNWNNRRSAYNIMIGRNGFNQRHHFHWRWGQLKLFLHWVFASQATYRLLYLLSGGC